VEQNNFDVIVIGGGHAGVEAAWAAMSQHLSVALVTMPGVAIASMPCNPSIGGVGKGQVVREIDALGGLMGKLADASAIQYRILNESKGYAVRSTRIQADKDLYSKNAELIFEMSEVTVIRNKVLDIKKNQSVFEIKADNGNFYYSDKLIITTGTFLNGKLHTGANQAEGGRFECEKSPGLTEIFGNLKKSPVRFKTGTPPRLNRDSIDYSKMDIQNSDPKTRNFSAENNAYFRNCEQVPCYLTRTTPETMKFIRDNKEKSPMFNGQITGIGPRYCPSIEDKAFRYLDRNEHHIFIEPEGLNLNTIYPNGISTSLPADIQEKIVQTIPGLELAKIEVYGYAVEYDVVDTSFLKQTLEYKEIDGLYFAGQVCGTSGYEEAAGQGIIAGINAARSFWGLENLILDRSESYIGVMIEDLVSNVRDEPYRLFTSRSENRLEIREDNVLTRMYPYRKQLGLSEYLDLFYEKYNSQYDVLLKLVNEVMFKESSADDCQWFDENSYGEIVERIFLTDLLRRANIDPYEVLKNYMAKIGLIFLDQVTLSVAVECKYHVYVTKMQQESEKFKKLLAKKINWEQFSDSKNVSFECRQRITRIRPETFGQLKNIDGIRPATLAYVAGVIS